MKHAIMIMAHKNFEFLHHLIEYFSRDCYVFVHIDKKSSITRDEEACLRAMPQVSGVYRKYSVHWGGFSILKCEIFLMKEALHSCDADYFHLISGQDYPIKPLSYFLQFFEENKGKEFLQYVHLPHPNWEKNTYRRFQYYYPFEYMERNVKTFQRVKKYIQWQKRIGLKRRIPDQFDHLYGSSQWFSITRDATIIIVNYTCHHPSLYRRLYFTFAPEESYIATVLINLKGETSVESTNYRFIRWKNKNGSYPSNLDENHFHLLAKSKAFFARKFESPISDKLQLLVDKYLITDAQISQQDSGGMIYNGFLLYRYEPEIAQLLYRLYKILNAESMIDIGCGAGLYVSSLRRMKIPISGYDSNPNTPELSALLIPKGDEPCGVFDITIDYECDEPFDIALCMDVLQHIPPNLFVKAVRGLSKLTKKYLIITYTTLGKTDTQKVLDEDSLRLILQDNRIIENRSLTKLSNHLLQKRRKDIKFIIYQKSE